MGRDAMRRIEADQGPVGGNIGGRERPRRRCGAVHAATVRHNGTGLRRRVTLFALLAHCGDQSRMSPRAHTNVGPSNAWATVSRPLVIKASTISSCGAVTVKTICPVACRCRQRCWRRAFALLEPAKTGRALPLVSVPANSLQPRRWQASITAAKMQGLANLLGQRQRGRRARRRGVQPRPQLPQCAMDVSQALEQGPRTVEIAGRPRADDRRNEFLTLGQHRRDHVLHLPLSPAVPSA